MTELDLQFSVRPEPLVLFLRSLRAEKGFLCVLAALREIVFLDADVTENEVAKQIVDAAFRVHTSLGPGLLESVYAVVLSYELEQRGLHVVRQQAVPVVYHGTRIEMGFRADLIVEDKMIVEIKSVEAITPDSSAAGRQTLGAADEFQRRAHQRRHHAHCQRHARLISRNDAKTQRQPLAFRPRAIHLVGLRRSLVSI
jgi:GxxExxY protein